MKFSPTMQAGTPVHGDKGRDVLRDVRLSPHHGQSPDAAELVDADGTDR